VSGQKYFYDLYMLDKKDAAIEENEAVKTLKGEEMAKIFL
jgi:hypothetical protein